MISKGGFVRFRIYCNILSDALNDLARLRSAPGPSASLEPGAERRVYI